MTEPKALIEGTSRAAITKEVRVRAPASFVPLGRGGTDYFRGGLLRSKLSGGGTLYYVVNCPGGTLLRSKVSGGHFTTGVVYFVTALTRPHR